MVIQTDLYQKFETLSRTLDYELLLNAINGISSVRDYDVWILAVAVASAVVSVIITSFIYCRQSAILKQQNRIALFEKRYVLMQFVKQFTNNISTLSLQYSLLGVHELSNNQEIDYTSYEELFKNIGTSISPSYSHIKAMQHATNEDNRNFIINNLDMVQYIFELNSCDRINLMQIINKFNGVCRKFELAEKTEIIYEAICSLLGVLMEKSLIEKMQSQLAIHGKTHTKISPSTHQ